MQSGKELLDSIHTILQASSSKCNVLIEKFPSDFYETKPERIYSSYLKFIQKKCGSDGNIIEEEKLTLTSITERFKEQFYVPERNGFYKLYHDIKLVCTLLIHYYSPGTRNYQIVDKFYKFAAELILRECYNIGVQITKSIDTNESKDKDFTPAQLLDDTELDKTIAKDFIKISTSYKIPIPQGYHIKTKDMNLFSSIISKSALDERPKELPNNNFEITKIIPQTNVFEEAPRLGFVAANTSSIPDPTLPPTEMMTRFLHPNWYALPTTTWLKYGDFNSWAPSFNENGTVLDATTRGIIWLRRIGYLELLNNEQNSKQNDNEGKEETNGQEEEKIAPVEEKEDLEKKDDGDKSLINNKEEDKEQMINDENVSTNDIDNKVDSTEKDVQQTGDNEKDDKKDINLENVLNWKPSNYIDEDEIESFKNGNPGELVTEILLEIQSLRKNRINNKIMKPSTKETKLYFKARRILKEVMLTKKITNLEFKREKSFPILQANYTGSIPVVRQHTTRKRKYTSRK